VHQALAGGMRTAERLLKIGLIRSAALNLRGEIRIAGELPDARLASSVHERGLVHA
jgi:hypothetical protein